MNFVHLLFLSVGSASFAVGTGAFAAASETGPLSEVAALEKKLSATRDELAATKTALAIAKSQAEAAEARARTSAQTDSQLVSLRTQIRILERDLQSATAALKRAAGDKTAAASTATPTIQVRTAVSAEGALPRAPVASSDSRAATDAGQKIAELQSEVNEVGSRLTVATKALEARDAELAKLRAALANVESRPPILATDFESARRAANEAQQRLVSVSQELAEARTQLAGIRELETRVRQLEAEKANLLSITAAQADAERKLAEARSDYAVLVRERDELRPQAAKAAELEERIRQLETEKGRVTNVPGDSVVRKEEFARVVAAQADAEAKLSTALRAFTLVTKERDELRARLAEATAKLSGGQEKR